MLRYFFKSKLIKYVIAPLLIFSLMITLLIWSSGDPDYSGQLNHNIVNDITQLNPIAVAKIVKPHSMTDIVQAIKNSTGAISIGGGHFSMGGQTAYESSLHLDMREYNQVIEFSKEMATVTVQSGITWHKLQQYIDPYDLSVKIMQTYANFTVGGSMSVNVHGRYIGHGPLISSVKSFKIVLADGSVKTASRTVNPDIFYATIGGYGGIGVIAEATLDLAQNTKVERKTQTLAFKDYKKYFIEHIRDNKNVVFHNADLYPPNFDTALDVSWYTTDKDVTIKERLIPEHRDYVLLPKLVDLVSSMPFGDAIREYIIDPIYYSNERIAWRNWEASYDVRELGEGDRSERTYVLQEYFIPVNNIEKFVPKMRDIYKKHDVDIVNVSIRHALPDSGAYLAWAREEVFAFVVYYRQGTSAKDKQEVGEWTREITDAILSENGTYYLPYQPHATVKQFNQAYPNAKQFFALKQIVDPDYRFRNKLWEKYYPPKKNAARTFLSTQQNYKKGEEQTYLTLPEWYLVFNPNEYVEFLKSGKNPSNFPFLQSINEYWTLYDRVNALTKGIYPENDQYKTMLQVIGISTTVEYVMKGLYENSLGRFTRWLAQTDTPEDQLIQKAQAAYAQLIYTEAWYKFPFIDWVKKMWTDTPFFGENFTRKIERKISFSLEFLFKSAYAKLIAFGAKTAYDEPDGLVTLLVEIDKNQLDQLDPRIKLVKTIEKNLQVITLPRWGAFTELMPSLAEQADKIIEINGNDDLMISLMSDDTNQQHLDTGQYLFSSMVISPSHKKRLVYSVNVQNLKPFLKQLNNEHLALEHLYDY